MPREQLPYISAEGFSLHTETFVNEPIRPLGPDGEKFYEVSNYPEISASYNYMKRYYEMDNQSDPILERIGGHSYLTTYGGGFYMPLYRPDMFDCSQMAALMEYYLERSGVKAKIVYSYNFKAEGNGHAWVAVDLPGGPYYIDATNFTKDGPRSIELIDPGDNSYSFYSGYDHLYESIYDLINDSLTDTRDTKRLYHEFDWWDSPMFAADRAKLLG
jgi:hypothetical protein